MKFGELDLKWKILVVLGFIFIVISFVLGIVIYLVFQTDLIEFSEPNSDISDYDFLFNNTETKKESENKIENKIENKNEK